MSTQPDKTTEIPKKILDWVTEDIVYEIDERLSNDATKGLSGVIEARVHILLKQAISHTRTEERDRVVGILESLRTRKQAGRSRFWMIAWEAENQVIDSAISLITHSSNTDLPS